MKYLHNSCFLDGETLALNRTGKVAFESLVMVLWQYQCTILSKGSPLKVLDLAYNMLNLNGTINIFIHKQVVKDSLFFYHIQISVSLNPGMEPIGPMPI